MAEEDQIIDDGDNEEGQQEAESKEPTQEEIAAKAANKRKRQKLLSKISFFILIVLCIFAIIYIPYKYDEYAEKKLENTYNSMYKSDVFKVPEPKKSLALATFKFPTARESEEKEFKIDLNDLQTTVSMSLNLAYKKGLDDLAEELDDRKLELIDKIQLIISSKSYKDINTAIKRETVIKKELINEINSMLAEGKIQDIYFTRFFVNRNIIQ